VDVLIRLERQQPPTGTVCLLREDERLASAASEALPFVGWLGLLRALAEVVGEAGEAAVG
jgi:hypothetical protein